MLAPMANRKLFCHLASNCESRSVLRNCIFVSCGRSPTPIGPLFVLLSAESAAFASFAGHALGFGTTVLPRTPPDLPP
jgi:hypothetical protein